jgi:hypothetical protein
MVYSLHRAVLYHPWRAGDPFFIPRLLGRLEKEAHCAGKGLLRQQRRHAQPDGGVGVVAAGVHHAGNLGGIRHVVGLLERQGIHIGADGDDRVICASFRHHSGAPYARADSVV